MLLPPPPWVVIVTKSSAEEVAERSLRGCGYRVYLPRYRKRLSPHGDRRRPVGSMRPLFPGILFVQDWRGWPRMGVEGSDHLMMVRGGVPAQLCDEDVAKLMARERALEFDEVEPAGSSPVPQDIEPGDEIAIDFGSQILATLQELTPSGRAIIQACFFNRTVPGTVDARTIHKV